MIPDDKRLEGEGLTKVLGMRATKPRHMREIWSDNFEQYPVLRWTFYAMVFHLFLTLVTSLDRTLFLDQFVSMTVGGQMFVFIHFNILFGYKVSAGRLASQSPPPAERP